MKFFMVSKCGEGAALLHKIASEGNEVRLHISKPDYRTCWNNLLPKAQLGSSWVDKETVIIFDYSEMGEIADDFRRKGHYVFGASEFADKLEHERDFGFKTMQNCGIRVPKTFNFTKGEVEKAKSFAAENSKMKLVFKPSGDEIPSKLTYVSSDTEDLVNYLDFVFQYYPNISEFVLQEFVEGVLVSSEFWCDGESFLWPGNHTVEVKKFMNNDIGPSTGCSGNVVWAEDDYCWILREGVGRIEDMCVKEGYVGPIDLNAILAGDELYGLEWTPRFGYDAMPTFLQLIEGEVGNLISDVVRGQAKGMKLSSKIAGGLRLSIPPYPLEPNTAYEVRKVSPNLGVPIRGVDEKYLKNLYFFEIMQDEDKLVHSDGTGVIFVASDLGDTVEESLVVPYKIAEDVKIPDKQYRTDLSVMLEKMYSEVEC